MARGGRARRRTAWFSILGAEFNILLGDHEAALAAIGGADAAGTFDVTWFDLCPLLEPLRSDPRFIAAKARTAERAQKVRAALGPLATSNPPSV